MQVPVEEKRAIADELLGGIGTAFMATAAYEIEEGTHNHDELAQALKPALEFLAKITLVEEDVLLRHHEAKVLAAQRSAWYESICAQLRNGELGLTRVVSGMLKILGKLQSHRDLNEFELEFLLHNLSLIESELRSYIAFCREVETLSEEIVEAKPIIDLEEPEEARFVAPAAEQYPELLIYTRWIDNRTRRYEIINPLDRTAEVLQAMVPSDPRNPLAKAPLAFILADILDQMGLVQGPTIVTGGAVQVALQEFADPYDWSAVEAVIDGCLYDAFNTQHCALTCDKAIEDLECETYPDINEDDHPGKG